MSAKDTQYTAEGKEQNLAVMNGQQTHARVSSSELTQPPSSDTNPRNGHPKLIMSNSSASNSSSTVSKHQLAPESGTSQRFRPKSPQIRQQLILRTSSPNFQPRAFKTYCHSPRRCGTPVSDTSSELKGSTHSTVYVSTVRPPVLSPGTMNLPSAGSGHSTDNGVSSAQTTQGTFAYSNPGFDANEEIVLNPLSLWSHRGEDGANGEDEAFVEEMVVIERPIYTQKDFDQGFDGGKRPTRNICTWLKSKARKCECSPSCVRSFFTSHLPFMSIMKQYSLRQHFIPDIIAGLTVGIMHIPQGMAYGQLSTLPPVFGLYVSFFPVILYFFFGTSKHVSIGTFAVISLMVGSVVDKGMKSQGLEPASWNVTVSTGENITYEIVDNSAELLDMKLKLAMSVTFAVGAIQLLLGVFQLGFLTVYLSDPLISGFTTGAACHVFTSQIKHIFGIPMGQYSGAFKLIFSYRDIFLNLPKTNAVTFIASIVCMMLLVVVKEYINGNPKIKPKLLMPVPAELIVVVLGTVISYFVQLEEVYKVKIVGDIPVGIPPPNLHAFTFLPNVISDAIAIAIVAFAISVSMAKIFAKKHDYDVDSNQELLAYGLCNVFSSFFSSFVSAVSLSRSLVQENVGGKTQVTGLMSSSLLLIVLLVVGPYFKTLPNCILASIILVALKGMFLQFLDLKVLWGVSVIDFAVWLITFSATVLLDVDLGLLVGVGFGLLTVIIRSQRPYSCVLGQVPGTDIYRDISVYKSAEETPGIKIFRFDSALFFANAEFFKSSLYKLTVDPNHLKKKQRRMNKQKKKDDKALLQMNVDPMGSTSFSPEDINPNLVGKHEGNHQGNNTSMPASKLDSQSVVTPSTTSASTDPSSIRIDMDTDPNCLKDLPTLTDINFIILDCSTMSYLDSMGVKVLQQVITEFKAFNITVYLAQCKSSVREMFECTNFYKTGNKQFQFVTIHDAVVSAQLQQWANLGDSVESSRPFSNINNNMESGGGNDDADKTTETQGTTTQSVGTEEPEYTQNLHQNSAHGDNVDNHVNTATNETSKM